MSDISDFSDFDPNVEPSSGDGVGAGADAGAHNQEEDSKGLFHLGATHPEDASAVNFSDAPSSPISRPRDPQSPPPPLDSDMGASADDGGTMEDLIAACRDSDAERVRALAGSLGPLGQHSEALLAAAIAAGDAEIVETLVKAGADPAAAWRDGSSALHEAAGLTRDRPDLSTALLSRRIPVPTNGRDLSGKTPLMVAAAAGNVKITRTLVKVFANRTKYTFRGK